MNLEGCIYTPDIHNIHQSGARLEFAITWVDSVFGHKEKTDSHALKLTASNDLLSLYHMP